MEGFVVYQSDYMGYTSDHMYSLNDEKAEEQYNKLIEKIKSEVDLIPDEQCSETCFGYAKNLVEENPSHGVDNNILKEFRIIYTITTSDENGTDYQDALTHVVMEKIVIEE